MLTRSLFGLDLLELPESSQETVRHGEVFTRHWVVETILDMVGYTADQDLIKMPLVDPACGGGAFLWSIAKRVSASCRVYGHSLSAAIHAVQAFDLLERNVRASRNIVTEQLLADGWEPAQIDKIVHSWIVQGDYLLHEHEP